MVRLTGRSVSGARSACMVKVAFSPSVIEALFAVIEITGGGSSLSRRVTLASDGEPGV